MRSDNQNFKQKPTQAVHTCTWSHVTTSWWHKITCLPRVQFSTTQQASRREQFCCSEPVDRGPRGAHTASHRVSLHLAALRVFCYHFCDKLKVSSSTALLTYQQAVATIQLSAHGVSEGRPLQRILKFDTCFELASSSHNQAKLDKCTASATPLSTHQAHTGSQ